MCFCRLIFHFDVKLLFVELKCSLGCNHCDPRPPSSEPITSLSQQPVDQRKAARHQSASCYVTLCVWLCLEAETETKLKKKRAMPTPSEPINVKPSPCFDLITAPPAGKHFKSLSEHQSDATTLQLLSRSNQSGTNKSHVYVTMKL